MCLPSAMSTYELWSLIVLAVTGAVIVWYTIETTKLRRLGQRQFEVAQQQFAEAREQNRLARETLEIERARLHDDRRQRIELLLSLEDPTLVYKPSLGLFGPPGAMTGFTVLLENTGAPVSDVVPSWDQGAAEIEGLVDGVWEHGGQCQLALFSGTPFSDWHGLSFQIAYTLPSGYRRAARYMVSGTNNLEQVGGVSTVAEPRATLG